MVFVTLPVVRAVSAQSPPVSTLLRKSAVTETEFIGALAPQPILAHLRRENTEASLADNEFIASAYSADDMQGGGLRMVVQVDQVEVLSLAYPWIVENYQFFFAGLEERKLHFTMEDLLSIRTLKQYAEP